MDRRQKGGFSVVLGKDSTYLKAVLKLMRPLSENRIFSMPYRHPEIPYMTILKASCTSFTRNRNGFLGGKFLTDQLKLEQRSGLDED